MNRTWAGCARAIFLSLVVHGTSVARAQIVADGATNILSNFTNSFAGDVTVGTNGSFTLLVLSDNALLTNSVNGVIGLNSTARSNEVRLISSSARWQMGNNLFVGSNGAFSRLVVSNGASVEDLSGTLAFRAASSNNLALVTGSGSLWTNRGDVRVGNLGAGNQLIVSNGGWVADKFGYLSGATSSSNNFALVTGSGSVWSNQFDVTVGVAARSNRLVIEAGGLVVCDNGYMGDLGGSNNEAVVTGPGSVWSNRTRLVVGNNGTVGHRLTVSNGAAIWCGHPITGSGVGGASNQVIITGAGSLWTNQADFSVGGVGTWLQVNNGGWLANANGYMFSSNTVALSGSGSGWNNRGDLQIGYFGDGCTFMASNGATVLSSNAFIGAFTSLGNNNFALLTGAGTLWSNQNNFTIGDYGVGNRLVVSDGGTVFTGGNGVLGVNSGANTNSLVITGSGTRWLGGGVVSSLLVGSNGSFNQMTISTGAQVTDRDGIVGSGVGVAGSNNTVLVTGAGSQWSNSSSLVVGSFSSGNRLDIGNFGLVENQFGTIGTSLFASNNEVVVHDPGAIWSNGYSLTIGESGNFNRLTVTNGGTVFAGNQIVMGFFGSSFFNRILVDGGTLRATNATGTAFLDVRRGTNVLNSGTIDVDLLVVTNNEPNGKFEFNGGTLITRGIMRSNDTDFVVNGIGATPATWDLRAGVSNHYLLQSLIVGSNSSFNQLLITNGGSLTNAISGAIGLNSGANSNLALLSGAGSVWSTGGGLYIGFSGSANQLVVSNGAQVINQNEGHIGSGSGATDNAVLVTGAGSLWKNMDNLFVGFSGTASRLVISDGGTIFTPTTLRVGTTNSRVVVDGGTVSVTNASGSALLTVVIGTHVLNAGFVEADQLSLVFASGIFEFNGGTLKPGRTTCGNGRIFTVGDGTRTATLQLAGGTHAYTNGLLIANNGTLTGFGTIAGQLTVSSGATLAPGNGIGTLIVTGMANLSGTTVMEAFKLAGSRFSDLIQVSNTVIYGGSLIVSNVGLASFTAGDSFKLFNATAYAGFFASLNLPPLDAGLGWTNKLLVDGSIEVIAIPQPKIGSITVSGTSVIIAGTNGIAGANYAVLTSTNVTIPMTDWLSLVTNQFDASGNFSITNPIASGELQSFFRIRTP